MPCKQRQIEIAMYKVKMNMELTSTESRLLLEELRREWQRIKEVIMEILKPVVEAMKKFLDIFADIKNKQIVKTKVYPKIPPMKIPYFVTPQVIDNRPPVVNIRNKL